MKYYIYTTDVYKVYETVIHVVEANNPKEAFEAHENGYSEYVDSINMDYGDCISSEFERMEDENGLEIDVEF